MANQNPTAAEIMAGVAAESDWNSLIDDITDALGAEAGRAARDAIRQLQQRGQLPANHADKRRCSTTSTRPGWTTPASAPLHKSSAWRPQSEGPLLVHRPRGGACRARSRVFVFQVAGRGPAIRQGAAARGVRPCRWATPQRAPLARETASTGSQSRSFLPLSAWVTFRPDSR
jgi:hypothetical protein